MSFVLKIKRDDFASVEKEIEFKSIKLKMSFSKDPSFERAMSIIHDSLQRKTLTKDSLAVRSDFTEQEAILFAIGEYRIKEWNVVDSDGKALEINGDNFLLLCDQLGDAGDTSKFISLIFENFNKLSNDFHAKREEVKKKL